MTGATKAIKAVDKVRFQLDLRPDRARAFDTLVEECDLSSRKELFNVAMSLFDWAAREARKGRKIASYDPEADDIETVIVAALDGIYAEHKRKQAEASAAAKVEAEVDACSKEREQRRRNLGVVTGGSELASI